MSRAADYTLTVVVPARDEARVLHEFHRRIAAVLDALAMPAEIIYVNDGSTDATLRVLVELREADERVAVVDLSRNFGKEIALTAGLDHARGDAVVLIDADLQHPPEVIPQLIAKWREGFDNVYAQRLERSGEGWLRRASAWMFYRMLRRLARVEIPADTGDFRVLSRRAVQSLIAMREQHRFMKGLYGWIGYPSAAVSYQTAPRAAGGTKWNFRRLWNLAVDGITAFSIAPLKIASYLGFGIALLALGYALVILSKTLLYGDPVRGYPSLMVVVLFLGGVQLAALGVIGEYLGRMFNETKLRPLYFVSTHLPPRAPIAPRAKDPARQT